MYACVCTYKYVSVCLRMHSIPWLRKTVISRYINLREKKTEYRQDPDKELTDSTTKLWQVLDILSYYVHIDCERIGLCTNEQITWKQLIKYANNPCGKG